MSASCRAKPSFPSIPFPGWLALVGVVFLLAGCVVRKPDGLRPIQYHRDTLAITNETRWIYGVDPATGKQVHVVRDPPPTYALRCFVLSRTVKLFHGHARFEAALPRLDEAGYRRLVRQVVARSPRRRSSPEKAVVFPGYDGLNSFSRDWPRVLQEECGAAWESYVQRGHWRMVFPFSRRHQVREADALAAGIRAGRVPVVHLVDFPGLRMNHAVVLCGVTESATGYVFEAYDPNIPGEPVSLYFDRGRRRFVMPPVPYFLGGDIDVYEVYCGWFK